MPTIHSRLSQKNVSAGMHYASREPPFASGLPFSDFQVEIVTFQTTIVEVQGSTRRGEPDMMGIRPDTSGRDAPASHAGGM
jgi:hypothetical protein